MPGQHIPDSMDASQHTANSRAPVLKVSSAHKAVAKFRALTRDLPSTCWDPLGSPPTPSHPWALLQHLLLGGSWVVIFGVISPLIWVTTMVTLLIAPLLTAHEPPSRAKAKGS